jgi:hypothetical protein
MSDNVAETTPAFTEGDIALIAAAEAALSKAFGGPVMFGDIESLRDRYRNRVLRCAVRQAPPATPSSVIVKAAVGEGDDIYNPEKDEVGGTAWRFYNEWAGTRFLNGLAADPPHSARLLAGDRAAGLFVLEDLGPGACLADVVQGSDAAQAEAALMSYACALGRLQADTLGGEAEWRRLRLEIGGLEAVRERDGARWLRENVETFRKFCAELEVGLAPGFDEEIEAVRRTLDEPGPFHVFSPEDTCPDNHRLMPDGTLRFFDFEFAGFRHALLDAAYFHLPFPTCWCVNRLPDDLPHRMEAAYRAELAQGCLAAQDEARFHAGMSHACAFWTISTISWNFEEVLKEDGEWGIATVRQRHLLRLETFAALVSRYGCLPALAETAINLHARLRALWPEVEPMPLYPAFRPQ